MKEKEPGGNSVISHMNQFLFVLPDATQRHAALQEKVHLMRRLGPERSIFIKKILKLRDSLDSCKDLSVFNISNFVVVFQMFNREFR